MSKQIIIDGIIYVPQGTQTTPAPKNKKGLEYCIIRTYSAGVWSGWVDTKSKDMCQEVFEARRLWQWWSEFTLSALAKEGKKVGKESENKYAMPVDRVILKEVIEIIPCSKKAMEQIISTPNYVQD